MRGLPSQRAEAHRGPHERVGRRIQERPEQCLGRPHLRRTLLATLATHRDDMSGERERFRQLRDPLRILGKRERDAEARLGSAVRADDARDDPLAADEIERELCGDAPRGERRRRPVRLGSGHRCEPGQRLEERHGDAGELARRERLVHELPALGLADADERGCGGARAPQEEARRRAVGQEDDVRCLADLPRPRLGRARVTSLHRSRHGADSFADARARLAPGPPLRRWSARSAGTLRVRH